MEGGASLSNMPPDKELAPACHLSSMSVAEGSHDPKVQTVPLYEMLSSRSATPRTQGYPVLVPYWQLPRGTTTYKVSARVT